MDCGVSLAKVTRSSPYVAVTATIAWWRSRRSSPGLLFDHPWVRGNPMPGVTTPSYLIQELDEGSILSRGAHDLSSWRVVSPDQNSYLCSCFAAAHVKTKGWSHTTATLTTWLLPRGDLRGPLTDKDYYRIITPLLGSYLTSLAKQYELLMLFLSLKLIFSCQFEILF